MNNWTNFSHTAHQLALIGKGMDALLVKEQCCYCTPREIKLPTNCWNIYKWKVWNGNSGNCCCSCCMIFDKNLATFWIKRQQGQQRERPCSLCNEHTWQHWSSFRGLLLHSMDAVSFEGTTWNILCLLHNFFSLFAFFTHHENETPFNTFGRTETETEMQVTKPKVNSKWTESTRGSKIARIFRKIKITQRA